MKIPESILKKVKLIEIQARKKMSHQLMGEYKTVFRGQGMTFSDFREYIPGDDVRSLSWPLFARTGKPYVKTYEEERETSVILVVDISRSTEVGSKKYFKGEVMIHLAALLGLSAIANKDLLGLLLFTDRVEKYMPPQKGRPHWRKILQELLFHEPQGQGTDLGAVLKHLNGVLKKKSIVFLVTDFLDESYDVPLRLLGQRHDVRALVVDEDLEKLDEEWVSQLGILSVMDPESGSAETVTVDLTSAAFRNDYAKEYKSFLQQRDQGLKKARIKTLQVDTDVKYDQKLVEFLKK